MLSRRIAASARPMARQIMAQRAAYPVQRRLASNEAELDDPNMNGNYAQPPPQKRQFRDPYGDWWDKQERRNYGEPVHEDNDILGIFSPEEYTHMSSRKAFVMIGLFIGAVFGLTGWVAWERLPEKGRKAVPRTFPGGLEAELGGPGAVAATKDESS